MGCCRCSFALCLAGSPRPALTAPPPQFCKAKLSCPIAADLLPEDAAAAGRRHAERLASAHDAACPWRAATSALSLLQFPPLTQVWCAVPAALQQQLAAGPQ